MLLLKCFIKGLSPNQIKTELNGTTRELSPFYSTIKIWVTDFKRHYKGTKDVPRVRMPKTATATKIVKTVVLKDQRLKLMEIADTVHISTGWTYYIVMVVLKRIVVSRMDAVAAQYEIKADVWKSFEIFKCNTIDFVRRFLTMDGTWIHYYTSEMK